MTFTFLGAYDPDYPRNAVIRKGLRQLGVPPAECRADRTWKFWVRYPILFLRLLKSAPRPAAPASRFSRGPRCLFVPEFGQKDVPLARFWATLTAGKVVFDPLAARYETKVIDWGRLDADAPAAWWNFQIDRAAFAGADLVLADTAAHKAYYCETYGLDPAKVEVLPLGYDDDVFRPRAPESAALAAAEIGGLSVAANATAASRPFEVLFTGSFLPLHGTDIIIEAARIVAGRDPGVRFTLVGSGRTHDAARRAAASAGLENVAFAGWRPFDELPATLAAADICLGIFGRTEKARRVVPHKLVQAMGAGRPVVTARTPAAEEFFVHRRHLLFCDEPFAESLAAAVLELKGDAALRDRIARDGCALVRERFSPGATARLLMEIVDRHFGPARAEL
jgi:glycosyltransferase involved in cell wall biosynthesis